SNFPQSRCRPRAGRSIETHFAIHSQHLQAGYCFTLAVSSGKATITDSRSNRKYTGFKRKSDCRNGRRAGWVVRFESKSFSSTKQRRGNTFFYLSEESGHSIVLSGARFGWEQTGRSFDTGFLTSELFCRGLRNDGRFFCDTDFGNDPDG